jgi:hypothetical protein
MNYISSVLINKKMDEKEKRTTIKIKSAVYSLSCPTESEVNKYLDIWNGTENFYKPEEALRKLFKNEGCYANNKNEDGVLIKIYALNKAYGVFMLDQVRMAKYITSQNIDDDLYVGDLAIVDKIRIGHNIRNKQDTEINFYSFATKYCSFHNPDKYPIFDSNVERALKYFKKHCSDFTFNNTDLRVYKEFVNIIKRFQKVFDFDISFRDTDKYLYLVGRELNENLP